MKTVKAGGQIEGGRVDAVRNLEGGAPVFIGLESQEGEAEQYGQGNSQDGLGAVAGPQRVVRPGHRGTGAEQDQGVKERYVPRRQGNDALGRPLFGGGKAQDGHAAVEVGPEEGEEEHHLGRDEEDHAQTQPVAHRRRVVCTRFALAHDVAPPPEERNQQYGDARQEAPGDPGMHVHDAPDRHGEGRHRPHNRPRAWLDHMPGVFFGYLGSHAWSSVRTCLLPLELTAMARRVDPLSVDKRFSSVPAAPVPLPRGSRTARKKV